MKHEMTVAVASAEPHANHIYTLHQMDSHVSTSSLSFYRLDALPHAQLQCQSTEDKSLFVCAGSNWLTKDQLEMVNKTLGVKNKREMSR